MLTKQLRDKWVAALRSGKYEQQVGGWMDQDSRFSEKPLCDAKRMCCLTVLMTIVEPETVCKELITFTLRQKFENLDTGNYMHMNDDLGYTFPQIADEIMTDFSDEYYEDVDVSSIRVDESMEGTRT